MFTAVFMLFGFGFGFEGIEGDRVYLGVYTPQAEYGYVVEDGEIWLDVVLEKNPKKSS
jgi:hypothetical protein